LRIGPICALDVAIVRVRLAHLRDPALRGIDGARHVEVDLVCLLLGVVGHVVPAPCQRDGGQVGGRRLRLVERRAHVVGVRARRRPARVSIRRLRLDRALRPGNDLQPLVGDGRPALHAPAEGALLETPLGSAEGRELILEVQFAALALLAVVELGAAVGLVLVDVSELAHRLPLVAAERRADLPKLVLHPAALHGQELLRALLVHVVPPTSSAGRSEHEGSRGGPSRRPAPPVLGGPPGVPGEAGRGGAGRLTAPLILTASRIVAIPPLMALILVDDVPGARWWALGVFLAACATDWLDGRLARSRGEVTVAGAFLDP